MRDQHKTFFSALLKERPVSRNLRIGVAAGFRTASAGRSELNVQVCCAVTLSGELVGCTVNCTPVSRLQSHDVLLNATTFVRYIYAPTREDSASGVCRTAGRSAASGVVSGLTRGARLKTLDCLTDYPDVIP
jgi:hypothetical protein